MRMSRLLALVMLATLSVAACGTKQPAISTAATTTVQAAAPPIDPTAPVDFATGCASRQGFVYGGMCFVTVPNGYKESSGTTFSFSLSSDWDISASQGLIVEGSGSVNVSVDGVSLGLNSRTSGNSGKLRVKAAGDHTLRIWLEQCLDANFAQVDCPATF